MMSRGEYENLYMEVYDNGFVNNDYKEKFKRLINYHENKIAKLKLLLQIATNTFCEKSEIEIKDEEEWESKIMESLQIPKNYCEE